MENIGIASVSRAIQRSLRSFNDRLAFRFIRYCISGGLTAVCFFGLIYLGVEGGNLSVPVATVLAGTFAIPLNFLLHRYYSFKSKNNNIQTLPRFFVATCVSFLANWFAVDILIESGLYYLFAQFVATPVLLGTNYFVLKLWVFSENKL